MGIISDERNWLFPDPTNNKASRALRRSYYMHFQRHLLRRLDQQSIPQRVRKYVDQSPFNGVNHNAICRAVLGYDPSPYYQDQMYCRRIIQYLDEYLTSPRRSRRGLGLG